MKNKQKAIKDRGEKQTQGIQDKKQLANTQELTMKNIIPEDMSSDEAKKEIKL